MSNSASLRYYFPPKKNYALNLECDICIYGANSGGTVAAITAHQMGLSVVLLEPSRHLGELSAGGLGCTDIGNKFAIGGLAREFYQRVGKKYGVEEHWRFEPHVTSIAPISRGLESAYACLAAKDSAERSAFVDVQQLRTSSV